MALFKSSEEKQLEKQQQKLERDLQHLQFRNLDGIQDEKTKESILKIIDSLSSMGLIEFGSFLTGNKTGDNTYSMLQYTKAIMEQNWIIIKLLDELKNK